jgi:hypothetical protein
VALLTASDAGFVAVVSARSGATLAADYDVFHGIEITGINHVVDAANHYYLAAIPESGANYAGSPEACGLLAVVAIRLTPAEG